MSFSAAFVQAAYNTAMGRPIIGIALNPDDTRRLNTFTAKIIAKMLTEDEKRWLTSKAFDGLAYRHHNDGVIFLSKTPNQFGRMEAHNAEYWYRAMKIEHVNAFRRDGTLSGFSAYGGIATNLNYVRGYFTNNSEGAAIVEWHIPPAGQLHQGMTAQGIQIKAEGDGGTYGLGPTGTTSNQQNAETAMQVFSAICGKTLNVVDFRLENRLANVCK